MKKIFMLLSLAVMGVGLWKWSRSPEARPGAFINTEPAQGFTLAIPFKIKSYTIFTLASFQVDARVLGIKAYQGDDGAELSPVDLALGWGPMSDQKVLANVSISQNDRFYYWEASPHDVGKGDIVQNSTNAHIIPATAEIKKFVATLRSGELVSLKGRLVSVYGPDGWNWTSSLSRSDTGFGACELFYVESASRIGVPNVAAKIEVSQATGARPSVPQAVRPARPQSAAVVTVKSITLKSPLTVKLRYGSLTIPSGEVVTVIEERSGKVKAGYGAHEFWLESSSLPEG